MRCLGALLATQAEAAGRTFHFVGVAVDWDVATGVEYLRELGDFDEISSGGSWLNTTVAERLFVDKQPAVPTLVLYERTITAVPEPGTIVFGPERELARFSGSNRISEWIEAGAPVAGLLGEAAGAAPRRGVGRQRAAGKLGDAEQG
jgi:hypothetical protein